MANLTIELEKSKGDWNLAILTMTDQKNDPEPLRETVRTFVTQNISGGLTIEVHNVLPYDLTVKSKEILTINIPREAILENLAEPQILYKNPAA